MTSSNLTVAPAGPAAASPAVPESVVPFMVNEHFVSESAGDHSPAAIWHSFRRHWVIILLIGSVIGAALCVAAWTSIPDSYTATATLQVKSKPGKILLANQSLQDSDFAIYKKTQRQPITSQKVLTTVLTKSDVARLAVVSEQQDQVGWLQKSLTVTFPDDAEIMLVSCRSVDRTAAETIANAVVDVYLKDVVEVEHRKNLERPSSLEKALSDLDGDLRIARREVAELAQGLGTGDSEALTLAQKNILDEYALLLGQLRQIEVELNRKERELKLADADASSQPVESNGEIESELDWKVILGSDPICAKLTQSKRDLSERTAYVSRTIASKSAGPLIEQLRQEEKRIDESLGAREAFLRSGAGTTAPLKRSTARLEVQLLTEEKVQWEERVNRKRQEAEKLGRSSVDLDLKKAEVASINDLRRQLQHELQAARIESNESAPRILSLSGAKAPKNPEVFRKATMSGMAGAIGLALWAGLAILIDIQKGRLNASDQLTRKLGLPVVGSVPLISGRRGRLNQSSQLSESIDAVAATILCQSAESQIRTVLITSAISGEGKTTLAANLANSLAGSGRTTLLIDFDLRRPALHRLLGQALEGGVAEVLTGLAQPEDVIRTTETEGLFFISAGNCSSTSFSHLTSDGVRKCFSSLSERFEFIIVDAAPVLPVVDTRLIARQADAVVLSILRDRSEISKVSAARAILETFGARILGAVMIGNSKEAYYQNSYQQLALS